MTPAEQNLRARLRAYADTFGGEVRFPITRLGLLALALRALCSPRAVYQLTFRGARKVPHPPGAEVLADLKRFCGINRGGIVTSPVLRTVDSHATVYRAGQRDVYLRIVKFLGLDEAEIQELTHHDDRK